MLASKENPVSISGMKHLMLGVLSFVLVSCVAPMTAQGPTIKDSSGMEIHHERLGGKTHMVTITDTRPGFGTREASYQSMTIVANRYAARICPDGYDMEDEGLTNTMRTQLHNPYRTFVFKER